MFTPKKSLLAFIKNPTLYKYSEPISDFNIQYCSNFHCFYKAMLNNKYSGVILDMKKVMNTPPHERNKVLSLAATLPTIRSTTIDKKLVFLDNPDIFKCLCSKTCCLLSQKCCYATAHIPVEISFEEDPAMSQRAMGVICSISKNGCRMNTCANLTSHNFIYIKIKGLTNKLPIYAGICWTKPNLAQSCGYNLKFINIQENQRTQLAEQFILPTLSRMDSV